MLNVINKKIKRRIDEKTIFFLIIDQEFVN